jgi:hypothetical protein
VSDIPPVPSSWLFQISDEIAHRQREELRRFLDLSPESFDREVALGNIRIDDWTKRFLSSSILLLHSVADPPPPVEAPAAPFGQ